MQGEEEKLGDEDEWGGGAVGGCPGVKLFPSSDQLRGAPKQHRPSQCRPGPALQLPVSGRAGHGHDLSGALCKLYPGTVS